MTSTGEVSFLFNQDMTIPDGGLDYEELIGFTVKSSIDNSILKAKFVDDPDQERLRRRLLKEKKQEYATKRRELGWNKKTKRVDVNEYARLLKQEEDELGYEAVWGRTASVPTEADNLSSFWYVESHTSLELKFKFEFDKPDSVSSGSYG